MNLRNLLIVVAFVVLALVAVVGWMHRAESAQPAYTAAAPVASPYLDANGQPVNSQNISTPTARFGSYTSDVRNDAYLSDDYVRSIHAPLVVRQYVSRDQASGAYDRDADRELVRPEADRAAIQPEYGRSRDEYDRSKGKSAAIVAGSAGVGAGIGALAGGGKGAALGAVSGGAAGFIYDRLTHKHRNR